MHEFPGPQDRIRRVLENALVECTFVSSRPEDAEGTFVLLTRRSDGRSVGVRFRGMRDGSAPGGSERQPDPGSPVNVRSVKREGGSIVSRLFPLFKPPGPMYARVRIDAGPATLDIVCQDAEWWEE
jgi:hypothetical protein